MPCRYEPGPEDYLRDARKKEEKMQNDLNRLTVENDRLREAVLTLIQDRNAELHPDVVKMVEKDQIKHRKEDLLRLEKTLRKSISVVSDEKNEEKRQMFLRHLGAVMVADPTKPLEPQLGFDPDEF